MVENELKWYEIVSIFFGIILGFADPITDILTLLEFYREDHKTWFGVGLSFIILPLLFFFQSLTSYRRTTVRTSSAGIAVGLHAHLVAFHFFPL